MFTGIIETLGKVEDIQLEGTSQHFWISSDISTSLKIDQSLSHNGVCLTVVDLKPQWHCVTAILETLERSNLGDLKIGDAVNLERGMLPTTRLDGHMVQGHVDAKGTCLSIEDQAGSWVFTFSFPKENRNLLVSKGSVCINGVSLTVVNPGEDHFSVAIIPYTYQHTTFGLLKEGDSINIEFDIIGKYLNRYLEVSDLK